MPRSHEDQSPTAYQRRPHLTKDDAWIRTFLHEQQIARIASRWDMQPFINTTTYFYDEPKQRIIFHSNIAGRIRSNIERHPEVCVEVSQFGKLLPANVALEFSLQYRSAIVFGTASVLEDQADKLEVLHKLVAKYFGAMEIGKDYRAATEKELRATSVYQIQIDSWTGKENWETRADQSDEWPTLDPKWFDYYEKLS
jgi:nitroimidazol reductase NimA-like FMN-containing flavoprotein (pyridoxamine 5'-phosphate oxidase superfamily)